jgi:putative tricarboxylic transport membrane protein
VAGSACPVTISPRSPGGASSDILCFLGALALRNDVADVWLTMLFGVLGFFICRYDLPIPPLVMGIILGPMAEQYFLTSMVSHGNDLTVFVTRPVSAGVLALAVAVVVWPLVKRRSP